MLKTKLNVIALAITAALAAGSAAQAHDFRAGDLVVDHPWSRATPEGARVAGGYVVIRNEGNEPDRLVAAGAEIGARTEIHEMAVDARGVMTMRPLAQGVEIPAGGEARLEPGGLHIMFMELDRGLAEGDSFAGTLSFEKAGDVEVEFRVEAMGMRASPTDGAHGHGGQKH